MSTIKDFIQWRGDLSFLEQPYNQIDYLLFSDLAYIQFDDIIELVNHQPLTLHQAFQIYITQHSELKLDIEFIFELAAKSRRYQNVQILSYVNEIDENLIKQFSATTFQFEDQTIFVAYRGTDDSLIGWHEDFLMLCEKCVPSQLSSVGYLQQMSQIPYQLSFIKSLKNKNLGTIKERLCKYLRYKKYGLPIIIGGHSKGGNLAMYAGCFVNANVQERIMNIYNYDGPGFQDEIILSSEYKKMLPRIVSYIPHYSFFGIVLGHDETYHVVHSCDKGMSQHNSMNWSLTKDGFVEDELSYESTQFAIKVILFLEKMTMEERKLFVETMFSLFDTLELYTFTDLSHITYKQILSAIKEMTLLDAQLRKMLIEVLHMLWLEAKKTK